MENRFKHPKLQFAPRTLSSLARLQDLLRNYLCLFIRDDMVSYIGTKTLIPNDDSLRSALRSANLACADFLLLRGRLLERSLREKVQMNVQHALKRSSSLIPPNDQQVRAFPRFLFDRSRERNSHTLQTRMPQPVNHKILSIIKSASSKQKLSMMLPTWAPWF